MKLHVFGYLYSIYCASAPSLHTDCREFTCTLCYVAVLNRNWILHFKCITDFDALQWALIACTKGGAHVCVLHKWTNIWCIYELHMCPTLGKTMHRTLYRDKLEIWWSIIWGYYTYMYMYITASFLGFSPAIHTVQKKQCWEGVYERGVAWPSHLRTVARVGKAL